MRALSTLLIGLTLQTCPTPIPAVSTASPLRCVGDCNGDDTVTVDELITGVNLVLGVLPLAACPAFDFSRDGWVTVDELLTAVNVALSGCPSPPLRFPVGAYFWPDHAFEDTGSALRDLANFGLNTVVAYYEYIKPDVPAFSGQPDCHGLVSEAETFGIDFFVGSPRGVIFFGSHQLRNTIPLDEPVWDVGVRRAARELGIIGPLLLRGEPLGDVSAQPTSLVVRGWRSCDSQLLIATSTSASPETGLLCFSDGIRGAYEIFEERRPAVDRGCLSDQFAAYGVHVYRITR